MLVRLHDDETVELRGKCVPIERWKIDTKNQDKMRALNTCAGGVSSRPQVLRHLSFWPTCVAEIACDGKALSLSTGKKLRQHSVLCEFVQVEASKGPRQGLSETEQVDDNLILFQYII